MPPPPPPPGPPPPPVASKPPPMNTDRTKLLSSIEGFKKGKLKKAETVDKSTPALQNKPTAPTSTPSAAGSSGSSGGSQNVSSAAPVGLPMGGMFAGGMPRLRKTGLPGSSTMLPKNDASRQSEPTPQTPTQQPPPVVRPTPSPIKPQAQPPPVVRQTPQTPTQPPPVVRPTPQTPNLVPPPVDRATKSPPPASSLYQAQPSSIDEVMAVALFPFSPLRNTDLALEPGDIIFNINKYPTGGGNGNWWEGNLITGARGAFPNNYVQELCPIAQAVVKYPYQAKRSDELSINPQDHIQILLKRESGWWLGACGNNKGLFPFNYIELL